MAKELMCWAGVTDIALLVGNPYLRFFYRDVYLALLLHTIGQKIITKFIQKQYLM